MDRQSAHIRQRTKSQHLGRGIPLPKRRPLTTLTDMRGRKGTPLEMVFKFAEDFAVNERQAGYAAALERAAQTAEILDHEGCVLLASCHYEIATAIRALSAGTQKGDK